MDQVSDRFKERVAVVSCKLCAGVNTRLSASTQSVRRSDGARRILGAVDAVGIPRDGPNVGPSVVVNLRCRIITFEGANQKANWRN